jgi:hypothetical protein
MWFQWIQSRAYSTDSSSRSCKCKEREIVIPTPKRGKIQTKTTSNTVGQNPSDTQAPKPSDATLKTADASTGAATEASNAGAQATKSAKPTPGELPTSTDEYVLYIASSHALE